MRRKLIVVSNRGPVSYGRAADGTGPRARRRRARDGAAQPRAVPRRHVDRERDHAKRTRAVAGETLDETARDGSPYRLQPRRARSSRRTTGTTTSSRIRCSGSSSTRSGSCAYAPKIDAAFHRAWAEGYVAVNRELCGRRSTRSSSATPDAAVFFHDYHLYLAPRMVRERRPDAALMPLRPHPVAAARLLARPPEGGAVCDPRRVDRERRRSASTPSAGAGTSSTSVRELLGEDVTREDRCDGADLGRLRRDSTRARAERVRCCGAEQEILAEPPGEARRARRPNRSVEEHRARLSRLRALPRRPSGDAPARRDARRCSTRRARTFPSTRSTSARSSARRAASTIASSESGWRPIDLQIADDFARSVRRVQAVRRPARERDLRRHEPRREGGAARQRARRRCCLI